MFANPTNLSNLSAEHSAAPELSFDIEESWAGRFKIADIKVVDRQRTEMGDIESLMESLLSMGQLQSVLIDANGKLIAGGRRITAMKRLGWTECNVIVIPESGEAIHYMRELEENLQREPMTWLEHANLLRKIHFARRSERLHTGARWSMKQTGALFRVSHAQVSNIFGVLQAIDDGFVELTKCESIHEAYGKLVMHREAEATKALAAQTKEIVKAKQAHADKLVELAKAKVEADGGSSAMDFISASVDLSGVNPEAPDKKVEEDTRKLFLQEKASQMLLLGDSLRTLMPAFPPQSFDHIFTDPPYGIEMENLTGVVNVDVTQDEHDRQKNIEDFELFLKCAHRLIKDKGFCVFFCDIEHFGTLLEIGRRVGFSCQAWPILCIKDTGENKAPMHNTAKNYECVCFFRKQGAVLTAPVTKSDLPFKFDSGEKKKYIHPFAKPRSLSFSLLKMFANPGDRILDPYCGELSMVTAMVAFGAIPIGCDNKQEHLTRGIPHLVEELGRAKQVEFEL